QAGAAAAEVDRSTLPEVGELKPLDFPDIQRATLSNGMEVYFAQRDAVPTVSVRVNFDAGYAADPKDKLGVQSLMLSMMDEGTTSLDSNALAIAKERLGANLYTYADMDTTAVGLDAMAPNLAPPLELMADYIRNPALHPQELQRVRAPQLPLTQNEPNSHTAIT